MKILFLTTHLNTGGITSYLLTLSKELISLGHVIHLVSSGGNMVDTFTSVGCKHKVFNIKTKSECSPKIYLSIIKLLKFIKANNIDIIHSNTRVTQVIGSILNRISGCPHVSTCHGYFKKRLSRRIAPCWGAGVIAISSQVKMHLRDDFGVPENKICLINNGLNVKDFSVVNEDVKIDRLRKLNIISNSVIGIIARLSDVKGHDILLRAMPKIVSEVPDAILLIVGEGKFEKNLKYLVSDLKISDCVSFFPVSNKTDDFLSIFDVFVMPSRQEGLGLSVMEAQAAGLAVVASRVGGLPSLIEDGKTGFLVEPNNPEDVADAVIKVLRNKELSKSIGMNAREFIKEKFSSERMGIDTESFYKKYVHA